MVSECTTEGVGDRIWHTGINDGTMVRKGYINSGNGGVETHEYINDMGNRTINYRQLLALIKAVKTTPFWSVSKSSTFLLGALVASGSSLNLSVISDFVGVIKLTPRCKSDRSYFMQPC